MMNVNDWPLIIFTLLMQIAVGTFAMSLVINWRLKEQIGAEKAYKLITPAQYLVGILALIGLAASFFHLGYPLNAPKTILNLGDSWMSREILFTGLFGLLWLGTVWFSRQKKQLATGLAAVTTIVGLLAILSMAMIYSTTLIPAWQSTYTFISFYGTCFMLGTLLAVGAVIFAMKKEGQDNQGSLFRSILIPISFVALLAVAVQAISAPVYFVSLAAQNSAGLETAALLSNDLAMAMGLRWTLMLLGGLIIVWAALNQLRKQDLRVSPQVQAQTAAASEGFVSANLIYSAFTVMIIGEIIGRYLFYASGVQIMMGG